MNKKEVIIYIGDISNYINIVNDLKPMLNENYYSFIEVRPVETMSGGIVCDYYLHIRKSD